jgi:hypothetical protein
MDVHTILGVIRENLTIRGSKTRLGGRLCGSVQRFCSRPDVEAKI